jgi:hypothetical protein
MRTRWSSPFIGTAIVDLLVTSVRLHRLSITWIEKQEFIVILKFWKEHRTLPSWYDSANAAQILHLLRTPRKNETIKWKKSTMNSFGLKKCEAYFWGQAKSLSNSSILQTTKVLETTRYFHQYAKRPLKQR